MMMIGNTVVLIRNHHHLVKRRVSLKVSFHAAGER